MSRRALYTLAGGLALGALLGLASSASAQDEGQKLFEANKCNNCHSIEKMSITRKIQSEKMAGPDLSKIGDQHDAAWIIKWAKREIKVDGNQHKNEYKGTQEDLEKIAAWLAGMKSGA